MTIPADVQSALTALIVVVVVLGYITAFFNYRMRSISDHTEQSKRLAHEGKEAAHEANDSVTAVQDGLAMLENRLDNLDERLTEVEGRAN